jgi:hypothetical protein
MSKATNSDEKLMLRFRAADTASGITRKTWKQVAAAHGLSETDALHKAMVLLAVQTGATMKAAQVALPFDASKFDLSDFASFLRNADRQWVESTGLTSSVGP